MRAATAGWGNRHSHSRGRGVGVGGRAEDAINPGKWGFWIVGSKIIPEPPPGTPLPTSVRWVPKAGLLASSERPSHLHATAPAHGD
jgi:hypothetical protein